MFWVFTILSTILFFISPTLQEIAYQLGLLWVGSLALLFVFVKSKKARFLLIDMGAALFFLHNGDVGLSIVLVILGIGVLVQSLCNNSNLKTMLEGKHYSTLDLT